MSCCAAIDLSSASAASQSSSSRDETWLASRDLGNGLRQTSLSVPGMHCAACIAAVERTLRTIDGVEFARVNLSTRRATVNWRGEGGLVPDLTGELARIGYASHLSAQDDEARDPVLAELIRALAVAGFCAMNIMILSVSVWWGAEPGTRHAFHLLSAVLALPAMAYSGRIFYRSAWLALSHGRTNMDVPISVGVLLAFGLSLYDTFHGAPHAYFDASTSLIFFLLAGRTLDHVMRGRARSAVSALARLAPRGANVVRHDGTTDYIPLSEVEPGMRLLVAAGDRMPVDGIVASGDTQLDCSLVSGESRWKHAGPGSPVQSGVMNLQNPVVLSATARADDSFLSEMTRMMEAAEGGRARYRRIADRAAQLYSPVVHGLALLSFAGWLYGSGDVHRSITIAIAVLIITCPCAWGLAVPIVQVVAARRLFDRGIMARDGSAFERLTEADTVLFDKTGTLTLGTPRLVNREAISPQAFSIAAALARHSRHPASTAIAAAWQGAPGDGPAFDSVEEIHGYGVQARVGDAVYRLGRPSWASDGPQPNDDDWFLSTSVLARDGEVLARFAFDDDLRPGAEEVVKALHDRGFDIRILSGDTHAAVASIAAKLGIGRFSADLDPAGKVEAIRALTQAGRKVLMIGDGLNDAPALAAAHVSMAPSMATDIGRSASDFVFLGQSLAAVEMAVRTARNAGVLIRQNFALAILYNIISIPVAISGHVTPLIAAIAMSMSSLLVVANALRLGRAKERRRRSVAGEGLTAVPQ